jgi:uncharacterized protein (DUF1697 family)
MTRMVALLRGINLGARNRISMASLRELLEDAGYEDVRTHLQSGNVVLGAKQGPDEVARTIEQAITDRLGLDVAVIVRTAAEIDAVVAGDPLGEVAGDPSRHFVVFLSTDPDAAALDAIAEEDLAREQVIARGREIHVWCPDGMRNSRAMKAVNRRPLAPVTTFRNWNTVTKLAEMAAE